MKKRFWVDIRKWNKKFLTMAIEAGADAVVVENGKEEEVKSIGKITVISDKGDLKWGKDVEKVKITSKKDEEKVVTWKGTIPIIIENLDWTIIPLENLISKTTNLIQSVSTPAEAKLALQTMERGADGVLLTPHSVNDILETGKIVEDLSSERFSLAIGEIVDLQPVAMSDRCCLDTTSLLPPGTGILVGNSAKAFFLVHNENVKSPYCAARPFRVNAGAVHAYARLPGDKTKYLSELQSGDEVLAVDPSGKSRIVAIGRNKIERRPMMLVTAKTKKNEEISLILQNAETIRLTTPDGKPASVTRLKPGDEVLIFLGKATGRHFGEAIEETIHEK
jgi:3-dehydroquinate synthase II